MMKPIETVAHELEEQGWRILWKSEVEAIAFKGAVSGTENTDIVELCGMLGVKLKKVGKEYRGLCPFHDENEPSFWANRGKGVWYCFGCGRGGNIPEFSKEWNKR